MLPGPFRLVGPQLGLLLLLLLLSTLFLNVLGSATQLLRPSSTTPQQETDTCIRCLCEYRGSCQDKLCYGIPPDFVCGPFRISKLYWIDGGSLTLQQAISANKTNRAARTSTTPSTETSDDDFILCTTSYRCAKATVLGYTRRYANLDCDIDGKVTCLDIARLHEQGPKCTQYPLTFQDPFILGVAKCYDDMMNATLGGSDGNSSLVKRLIDMNSEKQISGNGTETGVAEDPAFWHKVPKIYLIVGPLGVIFLIALIVFLLCWRYRTRYDREGLRNQSRRNTLPPPRPPKTSNAGLGGSTKQTDQYFNEHPPPPLPKHMNEGHGDHGPQHGEGPSAPPLGARTMNSINGPKSPKPPTTPRVLRVPPLQHEAPKPEMAISLPLSYIIPPEEISVDHEMVIDDSEYSIVFEGRYDSRKVAIKSPKLKQGSPLATETLEKELGIMAFVGHYESIVHFFGAEISRIRKGVAFIVLEYCPLGALLDFMKNNSNRSAAVAREVHFQGPLSVFANASDPDEQIYKLQISWCRQIASGMAYLESKKVLHGGLCAKIVLLSTLHTAKISNFGLARSLKGFDAYQKCGETKMSWRWLAPESLERNLFSHFSDVWSFGITMWEVFTFGREPFANMDILTPQFLNLLRKGGRLSQPQGVPNDIYELMLSCWDLVANRRPSFAKLAETLKRADITCHIGRDYEILLSSDINDADDYLMPVFQKSEESPHFKF